MKIVQLSGILALIVLLVLSTGYGFQLQISFGGDKPGNEKSEPVTSKADNPSGLVCSDGTPADSIGKCADGTQFFCDDSTPLNALVEGKCSDGADPQLSPSNPPSGISPSNPPTGTGSTQPPTGQDTGTISGYPSDWICDDGTPLNALVDMGGGPGQLKCANAMLPHPPTGTGSTP